MFSRVDGARRHALRCPSRHGQALPNRKRGRQTKSCNQCSRLKVHCHTRRGPSCERCTSRKLQCSFDPSGFAPLHRQSTNAVTLEPPARTSGGGRIPLAFLLNSTDEKQDFVTEHAVGEEPVAGLIGPICTTTQQLQDYLDPPLALPFPTSMWLTSLDLDNLHAESDQSDFGRLDLLSSEDNHLSTRIALLESHLTTHAASANSFDGDFDRTTFHQFFTAANVFAFATTFCRKRHYQYQILYWPELALEEVSLALLLAIALTGATYSINRGQSRETVITARSFYRLADSFIFHQLERCIKELPARQTTDLSIQACQAALLMYGLANLWTGDTMLQHTAIIKRIPALVSALRQFEFVGCRHEKQEDWQLFLHREQIIRLVAWTYCADCLATLCYNRPPSFSLAEMSGDLPCNTALWESGMSATSSDTPHSGRPLCLVELMSGLLASDERLSTEMGCVPVFHVQAMLCGTSVLAQAMFANY